MNTLNNYFEFHKRTILTIVLIFVFTLSLFSISWSGELVHPGGKTTTYQIIKAFFNPDLSPQLLKLAMISTWRTLAYAVSGITLALFIGITLGILSSGVLTYNSNLRLFNTIVFRGLLSFMRSIHELIWAWFFVAATGLSPIAAILALAIPYGGTLGKIFADILNDVDKEPINALRSSGGSKLQILLYGYLPKAIVDMLSYTMYRFECAIRSSTIMSFVGLGGLGYQINLSLNDLKYNEVWTFMFFLIALVVIIDIWSNLLRKRLVA